MAEVIQLFQVGRHISTVSLQVLAVGADGALSNAGSGETLAVLVANNGAGLFHVNFQHTVGILDTIDFSGDVATENISPTNRDRSHAVPITIAHSFTISEILRKGQNASRLAGIYYLGLTKYVRVIFTAGRRKWQAVQLLTSYDEGLNSRGQNTAQVTCGPVNAGADWILTDTGVD